MVNHLRRHYPVMGRRARRFAYFGIIRVVAVVVGVVVQAFSGWVSRLMAGIH